MKKIIGKTREQVLECLGSNYFSEYGGDLWVYEIEKTCFRRENLLMIEFDDEVVINVETIYTEE